MWTHKQVAKILRNAADKIENGTCGMDDDELQKLAQVIMHRKITLEQVCNIKGYSRATLSRKIQSGELPEPHKDAGGKKYYYEDEI